MTEEKIGSLIKTSLVDFPSMCSSVIFLKNCNLRCPYCYNFPLVYSKDSEDFVTLSELKNHLLKRKNVIKGFVISGGEALLNPLLPEIIEYAKDLGYKIKLDTNGTLPNELNRILSSQKTKPDFISVDIKTSPKKYDELLTEKKGNFQLGEKLLKTIEILKTLPSGNYEFRTVFVPPLIQLEDIKEIAKILPADSSWQFSNFINKSCLNPEYEKISPYTDREIQILFNEAKKTIKNAALR